jgi:hypothetical protein
MAGCEGRRKAYLKAVKQSETRMMMAISRAIVRRRRVVTMGSKIDEVKKWRAERAKYPEKKKPESKDKN